MVLEPSGYFYPNRFARALFDAMDDVMGQHGLSTLLGEAQLPQYVGAPPGTDLERAFDFAAIAALSQALEVIYGVRGGRGMALRIGQAAFAKGLVGFGVMRAASDPSFRALPRDTQVEYGLKALAKLFSSFSDQRCHVEKDGDVWHFVTDNSPYAWGRTAQKPVCHMMSGMILEALRWVTNGYEFYVREVACRATGSAQCVFRIHPYALGEQR